ncbi:MAG: exonuclease domain-containing protein [Ignavibacteria bacterium]
MSQPIDNAKFVVCDVETTGLNPVTDRIIEIALVKIENLKIVDKFSTLINPETFIPPFITKLTGIRNEDVFDAPKFSDIVLRVRDFLKDAIFVAHNASFDHKFLLHSFLRENIYPPENPVLCTKLLARRVVTGLESYGLSSLTRYFKIQNLNAHRAYGDALATTHLLLQLLSEGSKQYLFSDIDSLLSLQFQPVKNILEINVRETIAEQLSKLPQKPGVYIFKNKKNNIVYVGKAKNLRNRVLSYFRNDDARVRKIVRSSHYLDFIETSSELSAFLLESELIKKYKPQHNKALKIIRRYSFIALQNDHPFPRLEVTSKISSNGAHFFGPFQRRETAEQVLDIISKSTLLRECDDKTLEKNRPCYLLEINRCLGPCVNANLFEEYQKELEFVKSFLTGDNLLILNRLIEKMKEYSAREKFEDAAKIRDSIQMIVNNIGRIKVLKEPINTINAIIIIYDKQKPIELIGLRNGILIFIKKFEDEPEFLINVAEEYFNHINMDFDLAINIEKIKIIANFLVNQKAKYKILYTSSLDKETLPEKLRLLLLED